MHQVIQWASRLVLCISLFILTGAALAQTDSGDLIGPDAYPPGINPLTGLPVDDPAVLEQRPLIVKIINAPAEVRPQYGLQEADIVWEHLLAGGITRFSAIYLSQAPTYVGPIRSTRLVDFELVRIYRALLATSGMSTGTREIMVNDPVVPSRIIAGAGPCPAFCRDGELNEKLEYTLFANLPAVRAHAAQLGRDITPDHVYGMAFSEATPPNGTHIDNILVRYVNTVIDWSWDAERGVWLRAQDGEAHTYAETSEQISTDNVLIMEDNHVEQPYVSEGYWGPPNFAFSVNFIGSGRAILLRDGQYFEGEWRRERQDGVLTFFDSEGNVLPFKPGNTYFNLMPRWVGGYSLEFGLQDPATATITTPSANLRWGPTTDFSAGDAAFRNETLTAIGRNNSGTWVQVIKGERTLWVAMSLVDLDRPVMTLPLARPTNEF